VSQQVAHRALFACDGVLEPELLHYLAHRRVPAEPTPSTSSASPVAVKDLARFVGAAQKSGNSSPQVQLLQTRVLCFLFLDVFPYLFLVPSDRGYKVPPWPRSADLRSCAP
jgi:hypothetical protein